MKIKAITIENFKSISEPVRIEFKPLTLLFGPNSAGKSTFIQALHYIREVLEFRRLDVDKTISGGDFIDLGGFDNFVHGHDLSKKVSFEIELHHVDFKNDATDPDFLDRHVNVLESSKDYLENFYGKSGSVKLSFSVSKKGDKVFVDSYRLNYKNILFAEGFKNDNQNIILYSARKFDTIDYAKELVFAKDLICCKTTNDFDHTMALIINSDFDDKLNKYNKFIDLREFQSGEFKISVNSLMDDLKNNIGKCVNKFDELSHDNMFNEFELYDFRKVSENINMLPSLFQQPYYKQWSDDLYDDNFASCAAEVAESCVIGTIIDELQSMLYVGPLRTIPPRNYSPQKTFAPSRWSDGLAAWDVASYSNQETIDEINNWLGKERLDTGYALKSKGVITLEQDVLQLMENPGILSKEDLVSLVARLHAGKVPKVALTQGKDGLEVSLCDVGVGISQTFPVVMAALDKDAKIVIIEQPELHIHPRLQVSLGDLFISAAKQGKCMIIETHSEHLILRLMRRMRETYQQKEAGILPLTPSDITVLYVEPDGARSIVREMPLNEAGELVKAWPGGFFDEGLKELFGDD